MATSLSLNDLPHFVNYAGIGHWGDCIGEPAAAKKGRVATIEGGLVARPWQTGVRAESVWTAHARRRERTRQGPRPLRKSLSSRARVRSLFRDRA
jgi:hypothetical protein